MPEHGRLRQRILAGETLLGTFLGLGSPMAAEVCARSGLDWLLIDLEHGATSEADLLPMLAAVQGCGTAALVRVEQGTRLRIGRALDMGADGIMVPQVSDGAEARQIVDWSRYPPHGSRGTALFTRGLDYGSGGHSALDQRNQEIVRILQVESRSAVDNVEAIAEIEGVDVLFVGPTDLSHALEVPGRLDSPEYRAAIERVGRAAREHGKAAGVLLWRPTDVDHYVEAGFSFFSLSADGPLLYGAVQAGIAEIKDRVGT